MTDGRPHNTPDGRCRYTLGAERCPAPGVVQVGRWWVCALHECWAERPKDPELEEEGKWALREQQRRCQAEGGRVEPGPTVPAKDAAMKAMDEVLGGALERQRAAWREKLGRRAEDLFRRRVQELKATGTDPRDAVVKAVREVAVAAVEQRWGSGR